MEANDYYKVCVADEGNHDDRINHAWWGEKLYGLVDEFDDNALYDQTLRLADALIAATKDFDLMVMPNADHFMMVNRAYFIRRRYDYFVEHLMGETPPKEFALGELAGSFGDQ